ncbi:MULTISPECIES: DUF4145 domain-containing protein [Proteus]|uniref:DUF4145 domain-containing protein n=1 Tax=Proteus TaxID=583 RepID=UPI0018C4A383|nr:MULTISPECIES: DUF4145 domain-containing protein [Proteus]MBG2925940.1 DUF4145 domain-containing protein [Proteus mirabilis]MCS6725432.1 DUF4145 domain-containing protein [Proteus mirabilis]MDR9740616.1 DUF4145 domain-containing protein [Proteus terrae]HEK0602067.1 DUF4145 domain-containing protein [Proteus mirabilis]HEK3141779.1 DUF4145 domain-containing protein [Proteus mirabilis]
MEQVKNKCNRCKLTTNHDVLFDEISVGDPDDYRFVENYRVVKCCGCDNISFRYEFHDEEAAYPIGEDEWEVPSDIDIYPPLSINNINTTSLPNTVRNIFNETCAAISNKSLTLAGVGLRATIEAVCIEQTISGKELKTKINNLSSKGLISKKDCGLLHSIRFIGNDAAHEIIQPSIQSLNEALAIIEHMLQSIYIFDKSSNSLPRVIENYSGFIKLLNKCLNDFESGVEVPIQAFLKKEMRRVSENIKEFESELVSEIKKGKYTKLKIGKYEKYQGSSQDVQHFIVI